MLTGAAVGSRHCRARAQASVFLAGARNRARQKRQARVHNVLELGGTLFSIMRPILGTLLEDDYDYEHHSPLAH